MIKGIIRGNEARLRNLVDSASKLSKEMFNFSYWGMDHDLDLKSSIEFNDYNKIGMGYGLMLKEPIKAGLPLFRFPCKYSISSTDDGPFKASELLDIKSKAENVKKKLFDFDEKKGNYMYNLLLLTYKLMCYLKNKESSMKSYIASLPMRELPNLGSWKMEILCEVESQSLIDQIKHIYSVMNNLHDMMFNKGNKGKPNVSNDEFNWAFSLASSRYAPIEIDDGTLYLCPFIDYLNHSFDPNCKLEFEKDEGQNWIVTKSIKDINENEQLLINYGNMPNHMLAQKYGFAIENNPHSYILMQLNSYKYAEMMIDGIDTKAELMKTYLNIEKNNMRETLLHKDKVDPKMLSQARVWMMDAYDTIELYQKKEFNFNKRLNNRNEMRAKDLLLTLLHSKYSKINKYDYKKAKAALMPFKNIHDYNLYTAKILEEEEQSILKYNINEIEKLN